MARTRLLQTRELQATLVIVLALLSVCLFALDLLFAHFLLTLASYMFISAQLGIRLGLLDARFVFFSSAVLYSTAGSIDFYVFNDFGGYGEELNARILFVGSGFMFAAGAYLIWAARLEDDPETVRWRLWYTRLIPVGAVLMSLIYVALSVCKFGLSIGEIDRATLTTEQSTVAAIARGFAVAFIVVWVWLLWHRVALKISAVIAALVVTGLVIFDLLFFGDRRIILCMLLAIGYISMNRTRALLWLAPLGGTFLVGLIFFASVRGQPLDTWVAILSDLEFLPFLTPVNLDFGGFPLIASNVLKSATPILRAAPDYISGALAAVPSLLYPNRRQAFSAWYVETFHPDVAAIGGGFASNWVIEGVINFGPLGPLLIGVVTAVVLNRFCSSRARWPRLSNAASLMSFAFIMRYDFTTFLQLLGGITLVAIVLGRCAADIVDPIQPASGQRGDN